jgi:hypothetical protein
MIWKDQQDVYIWMNMEGPPVGANLCDEHGRVQTPITVEDYSHHMGYVDIGYRMSTKYSISQKTWKWIKKITFPPLEPKYTE